MIDFDKIDALTCEEVIFVASLKEVAHAAKIATEVIGETYLSGAYEATKKIEVFRYGEDVQYLTNTGIWQARYKEWSYDVECTEKGIFEFYKKAFMIHSGLAKDMPIAEKMNITSAREEFRYFVQRTDRMMHGLQ